MFAKVQNEPKVGKEESENTVGRRGMMDNGRETASRIECLD